MRESFVFYRSFYESAKHLPSEVQCEVYNAIMEYGLNGNLPTELSTIANSIFILIKPQIDKNNKRYENGKNGGRPVIAGDKQKPNHNQTITKGKPNHNQTITNIEPNDNVNDNVNDIKKESTNVDKKETSVSSHSSDYLKFNEWMQRKAPYCSNSKNFPSQITESELLKLKEKYSGQEIADIIEQIENRKDLRKRYTNLYRTVLNWAKKEYGK